MILWKFNLYLPQFDNVDKTTLYYKMCCLKTWYFKVYNDYMIIIPKAMQENNYGMYGTRHLLKAQIIKVNCKKHELTKSECMRIISNHWYLPYIKKYHKHCELSIIEVK